MQRRHRWKIELALGVLALVALGLVELAGVSGGVLVGLVAAEAFVWIGVAVLLVRSGRLAPLGRRASS